MTMLLAHVLYVLLEIPTDRPIVVFLGSRQGGVRQGGEPRVGLAVRECILAGMDKSDTAVECICATLIKVRIQLNRKTNDVLFVVCYASTLYTSTSEKYNFWISHNDIIKRCSVCLS